MVGEKKRGEILVSVVMPVYNAKEYLQCSLKDTMHQTLKQIEIICVDDGSSDGSADLIKRFMRRDSRIRLIRQKHTSAGAARNRGLEQATGKYVIFWDADDRFFKDALEKLYIQAEEVQADICICGAEKFSENEGVWESQAYLKTHMLPKKDPFCKTDMPEYIFNFSSNVPWNKLYRRRFILDNHLQYQDQPQANDTYFAIMALYHAKKITCVDRILIQYQVNNENSITGRSSHTQLCVYEAYQSVWGELQQMADFGQIRGSLQNKILDNFYYALNIQKKIELYRELYYKIQKEGLREFELDMLSEDDCHLKWQYYDLQRLKEISAEDFLLKKAYDRRIDNDKIRQNANNLRELLHKERTAGISYKLWRTFHALYRHTIGKRNKNR